MPMKKVSEKFFKKSILAKSSNSMATLQSSVPASPFCVYLAYQRFKSAILYIGVRAMSESVQERMFHLEMNTVTLFSEFHAVVTLLSFSFRDDGVSRVD